VKCVCRGPYPNTPPAQAIHLQHQFRKQPASSTRHHSISPILSRMDIDPKRICQEDGSERCLPKKIEEHLLIRTGRYQGGWVGKKNILFRGLLQTIMVECGCHKDQSDKHKCYGKRWSRAYRGGWGPHLGALVCHQTRDGRNGAEFGSISTNYNTCCFAGLRITRT
jgi:hypothetical protein